MKHVIGFWFNDEHKHENDRSVSVQGRLTNGVSYVLDRSAKIPEDGEYVFSIQKEITGKKGDVIDFVKPERVIVKSSNRELLDYRFSNYYVTITSIMAIGEDPSKETLYDYELINYVMRYLRLHGFDWVPEEHSDEGRHQFISKMHDKIIDGSFNPFKFASEYMKLDDSRTFSRYVFPFEEKIPFDPKYDILYPVVVPDQRRSCVSFSSKDIGRYMDLIDISSPEEYEKYKSNIHPDVTIKFEDGEKDKFGSKYAITVGFKLPEKGSIGYEKMLASASPSDFYIGKCWSSLRTYIEIPSVSNPKDSHGLIVSVSFFPDILQDILDRYKMTITRKEANELYVTCDDDYRIFFNKATKISLKPHDFQDVKFKNGVRGYFPAIDIFTKLKGKCINADMYKSGDTIENLRIVFEKRSK